MFVLFSCFCFRVYIVLMFVLITCISVYLGVNACNWLVVLEYI